MTSEELRIAKLESCIKAIKNLSTFYKECYPAWILLQNAWAHIDSIHKLETVDFSKESLGVKEADEEEKEK